jgi:sporulation protein YlmC with PRC-barrel domain
MALTKEIVNMSNEKSTWDGDENVRNAGSDSSEIDGGRVVFGTPGTTETTGIGASDSSASARIGSSGGSVSSDGNDPRIIGDQDDPDGGEGPGPQIMAAATLTGEEVVNSEGETLGRIDSIMLDVPSGKIAYAVLSFGGFLGMGDKLFAIPWQALQLDTDNKYFILNVDKEALEHAPGFDKDHWPSMADPQWARQVHSYYGSRPYWQ